MRQAVANIEKHRMLIGGAWVETRHGDWFGSFDPYAGKPWALVPRAGIDASGSTPNPFVQR